MTRRVQDRISRRRVAYDRLVAILLLTTTLALAGCPVTSVAGKRDDGQPSRDVDPGPPEVLNPSLLDRG
jgi:hypothetical protein